MIEITINGTLIEVHPRSLGPFGFDEDEWLDLSDSEKHETIVDWLALNFKFNDTRLTSYDESKHG